MIVLTTVEKQLIFFHDAEPDVIVPAILSPAEKVLNCLRHLID